MNQDQFIHDTINNLIAAELYFAEQLDREVFSIKEGAYILGSVKQFNRLRRLMLQYHDEHGHDLALHELPSLTTLIDHLQSDRVAEAVVEAILVRGKMAELIEQAETALAG